MATYKLAYGDATTLTCAVEGLASSATWVAGLESAVIDNTTNLYFDYLVEGKITVGTSPTSGTEIRVYVVACLDGTNWPDVFDGTTGAETIVSEGVRDGYAKLLAVLRVDSTTSDRPYSFTGSIGSLFGGVCPPKCVLFVTHNTGVNLNSTGSNHVFRYRGSYLSSAA